MSQDLFVGVLGLDANKATREEPEKESKHNDDALAPQGSEEI